MIDSNEMFPMDGTEESDNEEEQDDVRAKKQLVAQDWGEGRSFTSILKDLIVLLTTREGRAGLVHNFLRGLQLPSAPVPSGI